MQDKHTMSQLRARYELFWRSKAWKCLMIFLCISSWWTKIWCTSLELIILDDVVYCFVADINFLFIQRLRGNCPFAQGHTKSTFKARLAIYDPCNTNHTSNWKNHIQNTFIWLDYSKPTMCYGDISMVTNNNNMTMFGELICHYIHSKLLCVTIHLCLKVN